MRHGKYGCAVWGCGWVASGHINAHLQHPSCELLALGSPSTESICAKQKEFGIQTAACTDFQDLVADDRVDIISICTPNHQRAQECIQAAKASKHNNPRDAVNAHLACLAIRKNAEAQGQKVLLDNERCALSFP